MTLTLSIIIFVASAIILYIAGELIVNGLLYVARYFGVTEFVVAFFVMAVAASLPNLFVGINSALKGIPELSFGDIMGNSMVALTLAVGFSVFFSKKKEIPAQSQTVQSTAVFTITSAVLPVILISDGVLSRTDGVILIGFFFYYMYWLFSKKERFSKVYEEHEQVEIMKETKKMIKSIAKVVLGTLLLLIAAQGIVSSSAFAAGELGLPLVLIGILVLGFGSALPEVYFGISSARKGEVSMIAGNIMGAVIIPASLIVGIVALIHPIESTGLEFSIVNRVFLILAAILFFIFTKTDQKITKKESYILVVLYAVFVATMVLMG